MTTQLLDDFDLYSDLVLSVGAGAHDRPLTPIGVSDLILRLKKETGETRSQISHRLGLGRKTKASSIDKPPDTTQLDRFLKLQRLSRKNACMLGFRGAPGKIPFTLGALVADLPNRDDHDAILETVLASYGGKKRLTRDDVREIVYRKKASPAEPINKIIEEVVATRQVAGRYMIGVRLPAGVGDGASDLPREQISAALPGIVIASATIREGTLFVSVDEDNFGRIEKRCKKAGVSIMEFLRRAMGCAAKPRRNGGGRRS